jgi:hypothetical protein
MPRRAAARPGGNPIVDPTALAGLIPVGPFVSKSRFAVVGTAWLRGDRDRPRLAGRGRITFFVVGSEGERDDSTWEIIAADPPRHLELRDADVDSHGRPNDGNPMTAFIITNARQRLKLTKNERRERRASTTRPRLVGNQASRRRCSLLDSLAATPTRPRTQVRRKQLWR